MTTFAPPKFMGLTIVVNIPAFHFVLANGAEGDGSNTPIDPPFVDDALIRHRIPWLRRILIVDDTDIFRTALAVWLSQQYGADVAEAEGGDMALDIMGGTDAIDLVLLDIKMPERNGFEVCEMMRAQGFNTPVIFISADNTPYNIERSLQLGEGFVNKPLDYDVLDQEIIKCGGKH